ncbi:MAG: transcription termination/antitermination factor NusG [Thermoguttaceae bacterium]|nr:transcription termination/antitermination factor NusG [Thermoguttaceae bacterium]
MSQDSEPITENGDNRELTENKKNWYILKVQVNREDSIKDNLVRRVKLQGLDRYFDDIVVPVEKVTEMKGGRKRVMKRKLYPGYIMVNMEITDETWFLVRETPGVGDFAGAYGKPTPMLPHEIQRMLQAESKQEDEVPKLNIPYLVGDKVKIIDGTFKDIEGEVGSIDETNGRVTVIITIFARSTPVELEYWQIEKLEV